MKKKNKMGLYKFIRRKENWKYKGLATCILLYDKLVYRGRVAVTSCIIIVALFISHKYNLYTFHFCYSLIYKLIAY
jgi:hypothetical protein